MIGFRVRPLYPQAKSPIDPLHMWICRLHCQSQCSGGSKNLSVPTNEKGFFGLYRIDKLTEKPPKILTGLSWPCRESGSFLPASVLGIVNLISEYSMLDL